MLYTPRKVVLYTPSKMVMYVVIVLPWTLTSSNPALKENTTRPLSLISYEPDAPRVGANCNIHTHMNVYIKVI